MTGMLIGFGFGLAGIAGGFVMTRIGARLAQRRDALSAPDTN